jgi:hypothetical protein
MYPKYIYFSKPFYHSFLRNLTIYEINLQNLTLFLAKPLFWLFDAGIDRNKFGENMKELFMEN